MNNSARWEELMKWVEEKKRKNPCRDCSSTSTRCTCDTIILWHHKLEGDIIAKIEELKKSKKGRKPC